MTLDHVRARVLANLRNVDEDLAKRVAGAMSLSLPKASAPAATPIDLEPSPALRIVGKYPDSLKGRKVAILVTDGSDGAIVAAVRKAVVGDGGAVFIVAPKIGGAKLADGSVLPADGQLAGSPSVLFDAVAVILSEGGCAQLLKEGAAVDFVRDAFGHLKAIGHTREVGPLLDRAGIKSDEGVVDLSAAKAGDFLPPARTRQWAREPAVRTLA
ncbi:Catalase C [compost metagenome]